MEKRTFRMNNKLLYDVITRQAGTIEKAWLEIVQNAIDAGSSKVDFIIKVDRFVAKDNGKGMNKQEILTYFEEFGNSSKTHSDLGEFGMGRGQIFAQGKTIWRTQEYKMIVDVKEKGLNYSLGEKDDITRVEGTHITCFLYNKIKFLEKKIERFKEMIKFVDINVYVNGELICESYSPTLEIIEGKIILTNDDSIKVYNRGIYIKDDNIGSGAIIISTKNLKVNFARNDIMDECPVYNTLLEKTKQLIADKLNEKQSLSSDERKTIINLIREDKVWIDTFKDKKVIPTANNNFVSIKEVGNSNTIYFSDGKNQYEDDLLIEKGYTVLKSIPIIKRILNDAIRLTNVGNYQELVQSFRYIIQKEVNENELNSQELSNWKEIQYINIQIKGVAKRQLSIAKNMAASANTDGKYRITINYQNIKNFNKGYIIYLLLHEYSHDNDTSNTDEHGYEFYEKYYELSKLNSSLLN